MKNNIIKKISFTGVWVALIFLLTIIPYTGFIHVGIFAISTMPLFIAIATWHTGMIGGVATATTFGLGSYVLHFIWASFSSRLFYEHPEVAIIPRILVGLSISIFIKYLKEINVWKFILSVSICALFNSIYVIGFIQIARLYDSSLGSFKVIIFAVYINIIIEALVIPFISMPLYPVTKFLRKKFKNIVAVTW